MWHPIKLLPQNNPGVMHYGEWYVLCGLIAMKGIWSTNKVENITCVVCWGIINDIRNQLNMLENENVGCSDD